MRPLLVQTQITGKMADIRTLRYCGGGVGHDVGQCSTRTDKALLKHVLLDVHFLNISLGRHVPYLK